MRRFLITVLAIAGACNVWAQKQKPERITTVTAPVNIASEEIRKSFTPPVELNLKSGSVSKSDFQVEFVNFPENAKPAFLYVLSIYENLISSDIPIKVQAKWSSMGTGLLAESSPSSFYKNFNGARLSDVYYPVALAEKLSGSELNGTEADIVCTFNSNMDWYLGTDGDGPGSQYDFVTVALHEIVHGLGFAGFFDVSNGLGTLSNNAHLPSIYDLYVYNNGLSLCDPSHFDIPSAALKNALVSGQLTLKGNDGTDRQLVYAPSSWSGATSVYHYVESGYEKGDANALMSPYIFKGEAIHYPGDKTMSVLAELGWKAVTIDGLVIKDFEETCEKLPVSVEVSSELKIDSSSVKFFFSTDNFATSNVLPLKYNKSTRKFEGEAPINNRTGKMYYYYSATTTGDMVFTSPDRAPERKYIFTIGADYYPPTLAHNPARIMSNVNPVLNLSATATDNVGIKSVQVEYSINGESQEPFALGLEGQDTYTGELVLPVGLTENDDIQYRVLALDATARENKRYLPATGYFSVGVSEAQKPVTAYVSNFDNANNDFEFSDFEVNRPSGFSSGNLHTVSPYPESTLENQKYNLIAQLKYPVIIEENGEMSFDEVVLVEPGEEGTIYTEDKFWDFVIIEGSKNNGKSWLPLIDGYDSGADELWKSHFSSSLKSTVSEASGTENMFLRQHINLTDNTPFEAGDTVLFRFRLASDAAVTGWGWAIDNLSIQSITTDADEILAENEVNVYPNPFQNSIYIDGLDTQGADVDVIVRDLSGKTIYRETRLANYDQRIKIELPNVAAGVYLASVTDNQALTINQKIIKN
ncbi:T9SS type A sorting domain-containing protein [Maribellus sp. YY47]|uniref:T9SS type A sorting domain-containing protein n=1 Tax=Maribellus sp. YY47 TaxID=2929486 RepID=UPI002001908F|nr:T9SS type A sorting domain-containing protein [Maribellus sp. YY47]MCK3683953.1 T9SS type A sorting domain-containing protein [Maribellus sp. YY47]